MIKSVNKYSPRYIFLTYLNRSGSTYLSNLLSKSNEVFVCPEAESIMDFLLVEPERIFKFDSPIGAKLIMLLNSDYKFRNWNLNIDDLNVLSEVHSNLEAFLKILEIYQKKNKLGASIILFKAERLLYLIENIQTNLLQHFQVKVMGIIRDCRAVYASQKETVFPVTNQKMSSNPVKTAMQWNAQVRTSLRLIESDWMFIIRFEKLIEQPEQVKRQLVEFIQIKEYDFFKSPGDLYPKLPEEHKNIHQNIKGLPIRTKIDSWKRILSKEEISILQIISRKYLLLMGYHIEPIRCKIVLVLIMIAWYFLTYKYPLYLKKILYKTKTKQ